MGAHRLSASEVCAAFPAGTVLHNPVTGEYGRVLEDTAERGVGELLVVPGGAVAGAHFHPAQEERFEVADGVLGYRLGGYRGELLAGDAVSVPAGAVHDWWNAGDGYLRARVTVTPPGCSRRDRCVVGCGGRRARQRQGDAETRRCRAARGGVRARGRLPAAAAVGSAGARRDGRSTRSPAGSIGDGRRDAGGDRPERTAEGEYLVTDRWRSRADYERFLERNAARYEAMSEASSRLYVSERRLPPT